MTVSARETVTFTREQFYEKVWSAPATQIAKELGCSDVLIGKVCKSHDIPKPYLGYWARLEHRKNQAGPSLPGHSHDQALQIKLGLTHWTDAAKEHHACPRNPLISVARSSTSCSG